MKSFSCRMFFPVAVVVLCTTLFAIAADHTHESIDQVREKVEAKKAVLVDVREKKEWDAGHVDGAIFLPLSELQRGLGVEELAKRLPQDRVLYPYCVIGKRAVTAGNILEKQGYKVRSLKPGYKELIQAGFTGTPQK